LKAKKHISITRNKMSRTQKEKTDKVIHDILVEMEKTNATKEWELL
jgi:hypothetical protein